jgi:Polysulphide reductase, NrfD
MHVDIPKINVVEEALRPPLQAAPLVKVLLWVCIAIGGLSLALGFSRLDPARVWGSYYVSLLFFMGIAAGGVILAAIFQIVRATWSGGLRRIVEANVAFLPVAYCALMLTWLGKEYLFPWARSPRPGSEWWMQPDFVYGRFAVLFLILFAFMGRFVWLSLREDIGTLREETEGDNRFKSGIYGWFAFGWRGKNQEIPRIQRILSTRAPALIIVYALVYTLFSFEMIKAMDKMWVSNLFGAFMFVGNVYISWALLSIFTAYYARRDSDFRKMVLTQQFWDAGKLTFGFCMVWGYFFLSQFLPQWYGNLPEETQWLILRTREYPWKGWGYFVFGSCFVVPFIVLLSQDVKKTPRLLVSISLLIFVGLWSEKFLLLMPHFSPDAIPFGFVDVGIFLGFLGLYGVSVQTFMSMFPRIAAGHPLTRGKTDW